MSYQFWKFVHIAGAMMFVGAHGTSAAVALRLRGERDRDRIVTLLQLSGSTVLWMYGSLVITVGAGMHLAITFDMWGRAWITWSLGLLLATTVLMAAIARPYYRRVKEAVQLRPSGVPRVSDEDLARRLRGPVPLVVSGGGLVALLGILALMVFKPS